MDVSMRLTAEPLTTGRLLLRPFRSSDLEGLFECLSQEEPRRLRANTPAKSIEDAKRSPGRILNPSYPPLCFASELKETGKVNENLSIGVYPTIRARLLFLQ